MNQQKVYVADGFSGTLTRTGGSAPLAEAPGLAGIDFSPDGTAYAYAWSNDDHTVAALTIHASGRPDVVADLAQYEAVHNPDGAVTYGIVANGNPCAEEILGGLTGGPATYTGITDTHPYSVAWSASGWYVADAGMNAVLKVDRTGHVSTVAVLPPQPVTLTQPMVDAIAGEAGAPAGAFDCLVGVTYAFEPVPTDVEVDQNGALYVSILPGGPESPALGARGKVFKVNASTGARTTVASGLLGATNVAVASDGTLYATEPLRREGDEVRARHAVHRCHRRPAARRRGPRRLPLRGSVRRHRLRAQRAGDQRAGQRHPLQALARDTAYARMPSGSAPGRLARGVPVSPLTVRHHPWAPAPKGGRIGQSAGAPSRLIAQNDLFAPEGPS